jgi:putative ABC transport system permease protein
MGTLRNLFRRAGVERDLDAELSSYVDELAAEKMASGMDMPAAQRAARLELGGMEQLKEEVRESRSGHALECMWYDVRYGLRLLTRHRRFAALAVLTLALGIGATTATFSVVNAVLLRPLPYADSEHLVAVNETLVQRPGERWELSYPNFDDWRKRARTVQLAAYFTSTGTFRPAGRDPELVPVTLGSSHLFDILGAQPQLGRTFLPEEDRQGAPLVAVVSHEMWLTRLGADPAIIGKSLVLEETPHTIVGVMPPGWQLPAESTAVWVPLKTVGKSFLQRRSAHVLNVIGRRQDGATLEQAQAELALLAEQSQREAPGSDPEHGVAMQPLQEAVVAGSRNALLVVFGAVGLLLVIACANVTSLLLARAAQRRKEMAVRVALGASRRRLAAQLLTESLLLAAFGGGAGILVAYWLSATLRSGLATFLPRAQEITIDPQVLAFAAAAIAVSGLLFGLAPVWHGLAPDVNSSLQATAGTVSAGQPQHRARRALVVLQVATSVVLLAASGLMVNSLVRLLRVNPGFDSDHLLTLAISLPGNRYRTGAQVTLFHRELQERLEHLPGVTAAGAVNILPVSGGDSSGDLTIEGKPFPPGAAPTASFRRATRGYFRTMGIPLLAGRGFTDDDDGSRQMVVIINQGMARAYFGEESPLGRRIKVGAPENEPWLTVVGVVGNVRNSRLDFTGVAADTYEPLAQRPRQVMRLAVRAERDPLALAGAVRDVIRQAEKDAVIFEVGSMEGRIAASLLPRRLSTLALSVFALLALLVAGVGVYGVVSHSVTLRTHELGIRIALGAHRKQVLRLVLGEGMRMFAVGALLGAAAATLATTMMTGLLFEVRARDPWTLLASLVALGTTVALASYFPARRATRLDPLTALRHP